MPCHVLVKLGGSRDFGVARVATLSVVCRPWVWCARCGRYPGFLTIGLTESFNRSHYGGTARSLYRNSLGIPADERRRLMQLRATVSLVPGVLRCLRLSVDSIPLLRGAVRTGGEHESHVHDW